MGDKYPSDWSSRRKKVYKRDNYRCQKCGARGGKRGSSELHAHHIKPVSKGGSHRYSNLKTLCRSCHSDVHGHGVGGRTTSNRPNEADPVELVISAALIGIIVFLAITYGAVVQVLPAGQSVSEDYLIEYGTVTDDPHGEGQEYNYNIGPPLILRYELSDNVISENQNTQLRVLLHNPSDHHLKGKLEVIGKTNYQLKGKLATLGFDLSPGETAATNISLSGETMVAENGINHRTTKFNAKAAIWNDPYMEISTSEEDVSADKMMLKVRKPLWARLGLYWLGFLGVSIGGATFLFWRNNSGNFDLL
ncbi:MAG: HNH endonuclease [Halobacteriaceae archaeon]